MGLLIPSNRRTRDSDPPGMSNSEVCFSEPSMFFVCYSFHRFNCSRSKSSRLLKVCTGNVGWIVFNSISFIQQQRYQAPSSHCLKGSQKVYLPGSNKHQYTFLVIVMISSILQFATFYFFQVYGIQVEIEVFCWH